MPTSRAERSDFSEWLSAQLKAHRMSQRQLAARSGVDHSTISRLLSRERAVPNLRTATALAIALSEVDLNIPSIHPSMRMTSPTTRVERALRADHVLTEAQVGQIMEVYIAARTQTPAPASAPVNGHSVPVIVPMVSRVTTDA